MRAAGPCSGSAPSGRRLSPWAVGPKNCSRGMFLANLGTRGARGPAVGHPQRGRVPKNFISLFPSRVKHILNYPLKKIINKLHQFFFVVVVEKLYLFLSLFLGFFLFFFSMSQLGGSGREGEAGNGIFFLSWSPSVRLTLGICLRRAREGLHPPSLQTGAAKSNRNVPAQPWETFGQRQISLKNLTASLSLKRSPDVQGRGLRAPSERRSTRCGRRRKSSPPSPRCPRCQGTLSRGG